MKQVWVFCLTTMTCVGMAWALNPPITPPPPTTPPPGPPGTTTGPGGGYYDTETQVFHEDLRIVGASFGLHYSSRRLPGYGPGQSLCFNVIGDFSEIQTVSIALIPESVAVPTDETILPAGLAMVGTTTDARSLSYVIRAKDGLMWPKTVTAVIRYYWEIYGAASAGGAGQAAIIKPIPMNWTVYQQVTLGTAGTQSSGLGGWSPDIQHAYCPSNKMLYTGSGLMIKMDVAVNPSTNGEYLVASLAGDEIYVFSHGGQRHEQTINRLTGVSKFRFDYDDNGRLVRIVERNGNVTVIERAPSGVALAIVAPHGQRTELAVDVDENTGLELLTRLVNPAGETNTMAYTAGGLMTSIHSRRGYEFQMAYDGEGRLSEVRVPGEGVKTLARISTTLDDPDVESTFGVWDQPFIVETKRRGDPNRNVVRVTTGEGVVKEYEMDASPSGQVDFRQWEKFDWKWVFRGTYTNMASPLATRRVMAPYGVRTNWYEDGTIATTATGPDPVYGWQAPVATQSVTRTPSGLSCVAKEYRSAAGGNLTEQVAINGEAYTSVYTASNRMITATTPEGYQKQTTLDTSGRVVRVERPGLYPVSVSYDGEGRPVRVEQGTGQVGRVVDLSYAANGFLQAVTNGLGVTVRVEMDAVGRSTNVVIPDGRNIGLRYDRSEQPVGVTPPGRDEHAQTYTPMGYLGSYQPPTVENGSGGESWTYNRDRQLTGMVRADGGAIAWSYDGTGRLSRVSWPEGSATLIRDNAHRVVSLQSGAGNSVSYAWDGFLPLSERWTGAVSGTVSRTYDNWFRMATLTVGGGMQIGYEYDRDGVVSRAGDLVVNRDKQTGFVSNSVLGAISETRAVDGFGEVVHREAKAGDTALYSVDDGFDRLGRVTNWVEVVGGETNMVAYQYDSAGRLVGVSGADSQGNYANAYSYDSNGNRTQSVVRGVASTGVVDGQDRLLSCGGVTYQYGATGTLTNKVDGQGQATAFRYDARGALLGFVLPGGPVVDYVLDPMGRRVGKKTAGVRVKGWLYANGLKPVAELDGSNNVASVFVYGTSGLTPDYMVKGGVQYRIIRDHLGSVRLVVNAQTGEIVQRMDYDEWGRVTQDTNPGFQPFGFAGGLYDADTGLVRFGARDYDPEIGRWTARDPILFKGGRENLYVYCGNNPVNFRDPFGLCEDYPYFPCPPPGVFFPGSGGAYDPGADSAKGEMFGDAIMGALFREATIGPALITSISGIGEGVSAIGAGAYASGYFSMGLGIFGVADAAVSMTGHKIPSVVSTPVTAVSLVHDVLSRDMMGAAADAVGLGLTVLEWAAH